jgi:predicted metal-dependent hydrolase
MKSDGTLRLNIALLHCPPWYIDYVVLHELVHRRHMNHSPAFHAMVESYYPGAGRMRKEGKKLCGGYIGLLQQPTSEE